MDDVTLTKLLCSVLGELPTWDYREDGPKYSKDTVAVFYGALRPEPDRAIGVKLYSPEDGDDLSVRRAQLRFRGRKGDRYDADRLAGFAFLVLQGLSRVGGISDIRRISSGPLGADAGAREERSDNYQIILDNPEVMQ